MADVRPVPPPPAAVPSRPLPAARAQAIAAAQKAFFDQALASGAAPTRPPAAPVAAAPAPQVTRLAFDPSKPAPTRTLRPGSLLDIKV